MSRDYLLVCQSCKKTFMFACWYNLAAPLSRSIAFIEEHKGHPGGVRAMNEHDPILLQIFDDGAPR